MNLLSLDFAGRALLATVFTVYGSLHFIGILELLDLSQKPSTFALDITAGVVSFIFMILAVGLTVIRLPPKSVSRGWMPRIAAVAGTFMTLTLIILPQAAISAPLKLLATSLIVVGTGLSAYCLAWLGRSFSIDAQARRLVIGGPYAIVRHPLYVCEAITLVGVALANLSVWSVAIVSANLAVQYWRILNEERILTDTFTEYADYRLTVPQLVPHLRRDGDAKQLTVR
ncbi:methyltransferase family protein (plasmid) [Mesorhizobium sp. AaZ16]|uniref:methyltransferase family protein n=1 Tax=Mesorhizobium sp. AaZ16 TaxID=3402289 RepID=UPI00374F5455